MNALLGIALATAFLAGLAGGVHCAGMCVGIVHALCTRPAQEPRATQLTYLLAYNGGRLTSYTVAGMLVGALGAAGLLTHAAPQIQIFLLALAGVTLTLLGMYVAGVMPWFARLESAGTWLWQRIQPWTSRLLPVTTRTRAFGLGALWGWLPCGMVYGVLLIALAAGSWWQGGALMLAFGLGTVPNLLGIGLLSRQLHALRSARLPRLAAGGVVAAFGIYTMAQLMHPAMPMASGGLLCITPPSFAAWLP